MLVLEWCDILTFSVRHTGCLYFSGTVVNAGADDSITFSALVSSVSIVGGAGNDSFNFSSTDWTTYSEVNNNNKFYYGSGDGTDTLNFSATTTGTGQVVSVNVLDSLFTSVVTEIQGTTGINIVGSTTSGSTTTNTTIAYVIGVTNAARCC